MTHVVTTASVVVVVTAVVDSVVAVVVLSVVVAGTSVVEVVVVTAVGTGVVSVDVVVVEVVPGTTTASTNSHAVNLLGPPHFSVASPLQFMLQSSRGAGPLPPTNTELQKHSPEYRSISVQSRR
jgi:hypothetical protein